VGLIQTKRDGVSLRKIEVPKPYDLLAAQLREAILSGEIRAGASLPPERELVEKTGLTRGSVREALRTLAVEGLVETRPGRFGGNVVTLPGTESVNNAISQFVRGRKFSLRMLHETRESLEPALARLAATHRTDEGLRGLWSLHEELVASTGNFQQFSLANIRWHNAVAQASGNELLAAVLNALSYGLTISTTIEEYDTPETREQVVGVHKRILDAIEARKPELAERRMRQHISAASERTLAPGGTSIPLSED
jgi:DNA-binding FadR family transcriptional regulator